MLRRRFQIYWFWLAFEARGGLAKKRRVTTVIPNPLKLLIMVLIFTSFTLPIGAGETALPRPKSSYQIKYWTTEDGLPQHQISCLKQTCDGYLWIGTHFGLSRFDGARFTSFDESTTPEIVNESIDALAEDTEGNLWIGTPGGLLSYGNRHFKPVQITTQEDQGVRRLCASRNGGLWLCTSNSSVLHFQGGRFTRVWQPSQRVEDDIINIREGTNGWLNVFTKSKWLAVSPDAAEIRTNATRQPGTSQWVTALLGDDPGSAWIGTKQGMFEVKSDVWKPIAEEGLGTNSVELLFHDNIGDLWAGSKNEILGKWNGARWENIDLGDLVERSPAVCMEQDVEGAIWIATEAGLVQLHEPLATAYTKRDGIAHNKVWSVCQGVDGEIWVGTESGLSQIDPDGKARSMPFTRTPADYSDRCVWPRRAGGVWTARNTAGLFACVNEHFEQAASPSLLDGNAITCLGEGRSSLLLYVCTEGGIFRFRQDAPLPWTKVEARIPVAGVRSMLEAFDGTIWLGTAGNGVAVFQGGTVSYLTQTNGLMGKQIWSILENSNDQTLWFGTDKGLTRYKKGNFFSFTHENGLLEDRVNCVLADGAYLWLSGLSGIYRVPITELNPIADGRGGFVHPFALGTADGLKNAETNGEKQPAGWKARDGRLWFPTVRGVVVIDPKKLPADEKPPPVVIEQVIIDTNVVSPQICTTNSLGSDNQRSSIYYPIPAGKGHVVEFQYTANSLIDSKRVNFRYRLIGADTDWRDETSERSVRYINLRPGNYHFQVKAGNHHNVWNPEPAEFAFSLAPYFWQTKTFYGLSAATVLAVAAGVQAYRLRWQHRLLKLEQQRALAAERARIARDLHDDLGTALTGLALELDVIGRDPAPELPVMHRLGQTAERTRTLAERMREVVWSVNPRCDTVSSLASFLEQQIGQFLRAAGIQVELDFPEDIPALPIGGEARHQLALGVREALTNVVRHAQATHVVLSLAIEKGWLVVRVKDNGRGLQASERNGDGLRNMRERLHSIGGTFDFSSGPGLGTTITFQVPLVTPKSGESI